MKKIQLLGERGMCLVLPELSYGPTFGPCPREHREFKSEQEAREYISEYIKGIAVEIV